MACAAAIWPLGIDCTPARTISQKYAASNIMKATTQEVNAPIGVSSPVIQRNTNGTAR
ncbi:hypothetical protein PS708_00515 [Pseudomonas fluorescens]|nr:hypothetical protein PS708_00515 [Pseudomonas fluorescens]